MRVGANIPTGDGDKGLGSGKMSPHAILMTTYNSESWMLGANLDYAHDLLVGDRRNRWGATAAAVYSVRDGFRVSAELGALANPDASKSSSLTVARFGASATVTRRLDVDAGNQGRLRRAAPVQIVLTGATVRW